MADEIRSELKLSGGGEFVVLRFRSGMVLLLVRRPRGRWMTQMKHRIVRSPRLPKRCQCRPRLNEQGKRSGHPPKRNTIELPHCHSSSHSNHISMIHTLCTYNQSKTPHIPLPFRFFDTISVSVALSIQFSSLPAPRLLASDIPGRRRRKEIERAREREHSFTQC